MVVCPRCRGEMREGEAFVRVTTSGAQTSMGFGVMGVPGMGIPSGGTTMDEGFLWREKTGRKTGRLIKSDEKKTMRILGRRCLECGHVELYAQD